MTHGQLIQNGKSLTPARDTLHCKVNRKKGSKPPQPTNQAVPLANYMGDVGIPVPNSGARWLPWIHGKAQTLLLIFHLEFTKMTNHHGLPWCLDVGLPR
jgi:hypothetical protein